ncbi:MAG: class I SAM-dependent methyltransferase [Coriobacteriia bacterium]|nr:class I SAM-dependent methyltransferase [Coriobacteriia bacterium]
MAYEKFNVAQLDRLNDEGRFESLPPEVMWRALGHPEPQAIVDIGAGTGLFACRFAEMAPEAEVYAIDTEPTMVRWMLEHRPQYLCDRFHPLLGKETIVPFGTGEADLALMINLHHELVDPHASYREALRVLRIGGQLLVADWAPGGDGARPPQHVRAAPELIAEMLSAVGFEWVVSHPGLPSHSLLTARKPAVCGI